MPFAIFNKTVLYLPANEFMKRIGLDWLDEQLESVEYRIIESSQNSKAVVIECKPKVRYIEGGPTS